jgi:hypothetical protein
VNPLARRRAQLSPTEQRKAQEAARQQTALTVSIVTRKAKAEVQTDVMDALKQIVSGKA